MGRKANEQQLGRVECTIANHPGKRQGSLARLLEMDRSTLTRSLLALEERGVLLAEDDQGRLSIFQR